MTDSDITEAEEMALKQIENITDPAHLRQMVKNAKGKSEVVERAAFLRLVAISSKFPIGSVQHDCWAMISTVEEVRRLSGRKATRMNKMRPRITREGEIAALEYCALNESDGFAEVIAYGMPELTAEAIVLRHKEDFTVNAIAAARTRLKREGIVFDE